MVLPGMRRGARTGYMRHRDDSTGALLLSLGICQGASHRRPRVVIREKLNGTSHSPTFIMHCWYNCAMRVHMVLATMARGVQGGNSGFQSHCNRWYVPEIKRDIPSTRKISVPAAQAHDIIVVTFLDLCCRGSSIGVSCGHLNHQYPLPHTSKYFSSAENFSSTLCYRSRTQHSGQGSTSYW